MKNTQPEMKTVTCQLCGEQFEIYACKKAKFCYQCLSKEHKKTCEVCGNEFVRRGSGSLETFLSRKTCSIECYRKHNYTRSEIMGDIFLNLIMGRHVNLKQKPHEDVLDLSIMENCAYFRLYQLYLYLEPYYRDGVSFEKALPHTKLYLQDILRRIRNLEDLLRIDPPRKLQGYNGRKKYTRQDKWETGPDEQDLFRLELLLQ